MISVDANDDVEGESYLKSAQFASEIARNVNQDSMLSARSQASEYQIRRSPFVQRLMAKGKRFDRNTVVSNSSGNAQSINASLLTQAEPVNDANQEDGFR